MLDRNTSFAKGMQQKKQVPANSAFGAIVGQATAVSRATEGMKTTKMMQTSGATKGDGTVHSFAEEEVLAFSDFMNSKLGGDAQLQYLLPISNPDELFGSVADGVLLSKMINVAAPDTIDERVLNLGPRNPFQVGENQNLMINAAKSIGLKVINIGSEDMIEGRPHLVLGLLWQMVKMALMARQHAQSAPPWPCPSSAPAPTQGAPFGSGQLSTPKKRPSLWAPSQCLGCSSQPPPKPPIFLAFEHPGAHQPAQLPLPGAAAAGRRDARGPAQAHARADPPARGRRRAELRHLTSHVSRLPASTLASTPTSTPPHPPTHLHGSPHGRAWAPRLVPPVRRRRKPIEAWSPP